MAPKWATNARNRRYARNVCVLRNTAYSITLCGRMGKRCTDPKSTIGYRAADNIPQPTSGSTNSNVYNNTSDACATKRSCEDMVGGNGGRVLNWRFTKRITTKIRMAIPNGRWIDTRL